MRMLRPLAVVLALAAVPFVITALSRVPVVAAAENGRDPAKATPESVGLVGGTWFSVDPIADLGFVGMIQQ